MDGERPARDEGAGGGRTELCLALAFAFHTVVLEIVVLRSLDDTPAPPAVRVERTIAVDLEPQLAVKRPVAQAARARSPRRAPAAVDLDPDDPYDDLPGAPPAAAARVLTAEGPGDRPVVASGDAVGPSYGFVAGAATGTVPTLDPRHGGGGPGGPGSSGAAPLAGPAPPASAAGPYAAAAPFVAVVDHSRPASLLGGYTDECPFPGEADRDGVDHALVLIAVTVRPDGTAYGARAVSDPGYGFAREATRCALVQRFTPALDAAGKPTWAPALTIRVRFTR